MFYLKIHHVNVFESNIRNTLFSAESEQLLFDININIQKGEIFGIMGPSGCGKTILLKTITGIINPEDGDIYLNEVPLKSIPPSERKISMVFQDFVLYPNMTNLMNLRYPVIIHRSKGKTFKEIDINTVSSLLHIDEQKLLNTYPRYTSLGERQRIAIGKAIMSMPDLLLLDEPLSNIEDSLREEIRHNLRRLIREHEMTAIYVSHNQHEIGEISDNIAVMRQGMIEQIGTYAELYDNPKTLFVSIIIGDKSNNLLTSQEVGKLTGGKIPYSLTIRPSECLLENKEESIEIEGEVSFIENLIQEGKKIVFIDKSGDLFGVEVPIDHPIENNQNIKIYIPISRAKFFNDRENSKFQERVFNLW
jgi:ABC-type sugar transport system ATPase subunit